MINAIHLRDYVIRPTLIGLGKWSQAAENLLIGTIFQESAGGHYLHQIGGGPALGIYQIEPATHDDVWDNFISYRDELEADVIEFMTDEERDGQLMTNLSYATVIARIIYFRKPEPLPDSHDVHALGAYWKMHFNTIQGKGTVDEFVKNFPTEILR